MNPTAVEPDLTLARTYRLRSGVHLVRGADGARLNAWPHAVDLGEPTAAQVGLLRDLAGRDVPHGVLSADPDLLELLERGGWLDVTHAGPGGPLVTVQSYGSDPGRPGPVDADVELHRDVVVRREDDAVVLERPGRWPTLRVHDAEALGVLTGLAPADSPTARGVVAVAAAAGHLVPRVGPEGRTLQDLQWQPHERWFHERSRLSSRGHFGAAFGGTFWARGRFDPLPARPPRRDGRRVALATADIAALRRSDPPLTAVLEDRASIRTHDDEHPLRLDQLGELLHRTSRVRYTRTVDDLEYANKPYPSGGSMYELEVYPVVRLVDGLEPAMYHYDAHEHALVEVAGIDDPAVQRMLRVAAHSTVAWEQPQVLLVVSARVGRIMWKYEAMAYALVLKHVGVLYQTLYTVATAMGLAPCAVGSGDAHAFSDATGTDPADEPNVGEFLLGSRRANVPIWEM